MGYEHEYNFGTKGQEKKVGRKHKKEIIHLENHIELNFFSHERR